MLTSMDRARLAESNLFKGIDLATVADLVDVCRVRERPKGALVLSPAVRNDHVYVLLEGTVDVELDVPGVPPHRTIGPGDCLGELSLIDGRPPTATVVALEPVRFFVIHRDILWTLVDHSDGLARNLLYVLSGRMRNENQALRDAQRARHALEHAASVDALTGVHNRRWMAETFHRQLERSQRDGQPVCAMMADIDQFKEYNDHHGHMAGDAALQSVARVLDAHVRPGDLLARYGGEEFALLLPGAPLAAALETAERLRQAVEAQEVLDENDMVLPPVTISIGVAEAQPGEAMDHLTRRSDEALYVAKNAGRNRVSGGN